mgnify:CR=1 FL=1
MSLTKKTFVLRINDETFSALAKWAEDEFRSVNGQIEMILDKALKEAAQLLVDELKKQTIEVGGIVINVYDTIIKLLKKEQLEDEIKNHPTIVAGKAVVEKYNEIKKKKPSIGSQFKPSIKFPFPELPKRKDLIEKAKSKLIEEATKQIKEKLIPPIQEKILQPIIAPIQIAVELSKSIPSPSSSAHSACERSARLGARRLRSMRPRRRNVLKEDSQLKRLN